MDRVRTNIITAVTLFRILIVEEEAEAQASDLVRYGLVGMAIQKKQLILEGPHA